MGPGPVRWGLLQFAEQSIGVIFLVIGSYRSVAFCVRVWTWQSFVSLDYSQTQIPTNPHRDTGTRVIDWGRALRWRKELEAPPWPRPSGADSCEGESKEHWEQKTHRSPDLFVARHAPSVTVRPPQTSCLLLSRVSISRA